MRGVSSSSSRTEPGLRHAPRRCATADPYAQVAAAGPSLKRTIRTGAAVPGSRRCNAATEETAEPVRLPASSRPARPGSRTGPTTRCASPTRFRPSSIRLRGSFARRFGPCGRCYGPRPNGPCRGDRGGHGRLRRSPGGAGHRGVLSRRRGESAARPPRLYPRVEEAGNVSRRSSKRGSSPTRGAWSTRSGADRTAASGLLGLGSDDRRESVARRGQAQRIHRDPDRGDPGTRQPAVRKPSFEAGASAWRRLDRAR